MAHHLGSNQQHNHHRRLLHIHRHTLRLAAMSGKASIIDKLVEQYKQPQLSNDDYQRAVVLNVAHSYWLATKAGDKMFEVRKMTSNLLSCRHLILKSLETKETFTVEVTYRLPLKELNTWWADTFKSDTSHIMVMGLKESSVQFQLPAKGEQ